MPDDPHHVTVAIHNGVVVTLIVGVDYVFTWRSSRYPRPYTCRSRMGFLGPVGDDTVELEFNGLGPNRSTEDPYCKTKSFVPSDIRTIREVVPDSAARYSEKRI